MKRIKGLMKEILSKTLRTMGYEIVYHGHNFRVKDERANEYARNAHLQYIFDRMNINCVFDIGANEGQYARNLRGLGYDGYIISFEPVSATYSILEKSASRDPKWKAYKLALGTENKKSEINLFGTSLFNSFLTYENEEVSTSNISKLCSQADLPTESYTIAGREEVEIKRLDNVYNEIVKDLGIECRLFIKLDTQGYDLEVLKGGKETIQKAIGLQSEISFIQLYQGMPGYLDSLHFFESLGFQVTGLFCVSRYAKSLAAVEFDCIMKSSLID
ncbi:methyltransferase, FkbM family [Pleurocapsa sp. PCC 7327]|uniref:FkbM family methyltransferase n=1 Tax=Pleurocapsa sp. PCC 7327 TaxID=118163 RepID=UPI00029FC7D9|nr:FkbM family methyltransferase [Pleurocapsa sp. PCC 7327]AFY76775.1 methyltransferase, FkbM family [Pleurocapsa sp. PCC 7327]